MQQINQIYINGQFVTPRGDELFDLFNPTTAEPFGQVRLADEQDALEAIRAAKRAFPEFSHTTKATRIDYLKRMHAAVVSVETELTEAIIKEYGAPTTRAVWMARHAANVFLEMVQVLQDYEFNQSIGIAEVTLQPLGVAGLITPWNSNAGFICGKLAAALAAGCTAVIKPSEMSALQTSIVTRALHQAGLPAGAFNIVTGRGDTVGAVLSTHPDIAKVSFTGSTAVGKHILRAGAETLKRITLELGGKSPVLILDDADFNTAIPMALQAGFMNSGQACIAGTRILVPEHRLAEVEALVIKEAATIRAGAPQDPNSSVGPMVSLKQWQRVQRYIQLGLEEGAHLLVGGPGLPDGIEAGWFVKPTVFSRVTNQMTIAREEIFGPVLSIITYKDEAEALSIANDTPYGLQAYILTSNVPKAHMLAAQIDAGRVLINTLAHEPRAPFGGFKQSGIGREYGSFGLQAFLEPKSVLA
ncbi:aldehyde dehydrogenase family protein [Pseudomonas poae]|uniref:aldehyde dehydrogenase (NAD(+)) n=1 Tax=Pseudomonas poae TaxID=200451 RepID=A0A2S9E8Q7_9PSED|nr:aldehyde dehydrogenase family protein [Pseudomonas poae]PRA21852.1 aldehyde dehydrogenase family protein [Pseudomonas poae]PRC11255.1 aldehyde dehydrogenase family protein [Pseudomonas poae]